MKMLTPAQFAKIKQPDINPTCADCKATPHCPKCGRFTKLTFTSDSLYGPAHHRYACYGCPGSEFPVYCNERLGTYRMIEVRR